MTDLQKKLIIYKQMKGEKMEKKFCTQLKKMNFLKFLNEKYQTKTFEEISAEKLITIIHGTRKN